MHTISMVEPVTARPARTITADQLTVGDILRTAVPWTDEQIRRETVTVIDRDERGVWVDLAGRIRRMRMLHTDEVTVDG